MLDRTTYPLNVSLARVKLTDGAGGSEVRRTKNGWGSFTVQDDTSPVEILYGLHDLYIEGFRVRSGVYLHRDSKYAINHDGKFGFGCEYKELGWDRLGAITVTLDNVNGALSTLYNYSRTTNQDAVKKAYLYMAIAFAEAVRFDDVLTNVIQGNPIADVDWDKHKLPSKVRVVKS